MMDAGAESDQSPEPGIGVEVRPLPRNPSDGDEAPLPQVDTMSGAPTLMTTAPPESSGASSAGGETSSID